MCDTIAPSPGYIDACIKSRNNREKKNLKKEVLTRRINAAPDRNHISVSPQSFGAYVTIFSGYIRTHNIYVHAHLLDGYLSRSVCDYYRASVRVHQYSRSRSHAYVRVYDFECGRTRYIRTCPCPPVYMCVCGKVYKVTAGAEAATTTSTRCREKNCGGGGRERRDEAKEGEGRGDGETTTRSFSLPSTLRIPNLGHTDTNAISVPVGERRRRGGGENESRNSCRGGPKVTNLRVARREKAAECKCRLSTEFRRAITLQFCSIRNNYVLRIAHIFSCIFFQMRINLYSELIKRQRLICV